MSYEDNGVDGVFSLLQPQNPSWFSCCCFCLFFFFLNPDLVAHTVILALRNWKELRVLGLLVC